jgi:hypothetical protein
MHTVPGYKRAEAFLCRWKTGAEDTRSSKNETNRIAFCGSSITPKFQTAGTTRFVVPTRFKLSRLNDRETINIFCI